MDPNAWTERQIWIRGGGIFALFCLVALALSAGPISRDAASRAGEIILLEGHPWASVERHGRGMAIAGVAPSAEAGEAARDAVDDDWSVRDAWAAFTVEAPKPAQSPNSDTGTADAPLTASGPAIADASECQALLDGLLGDNIVHFAHGKATLEASSHGLLRTLGAALLRCETAVISIDGHTDATGAADVNQALSLARAEAVVAFLTARGVPTGRITAKGFGASKPIADNDTEAGRAQNRRIEFKVASAGDTK